MIGISIPHPERFFAPVYWELSKANTRFIINYGGTGCFQPNQLVFTNGVSKQISQIKVGDIVKSFNEKSGKVELKPVLHVWEYCNTKPTVRIKLKNGKEIICTEDHKFYYGGSWVMVKDLLSLRDGRNMEANTEL